VAARPPCSSPSFLLYRARKRVTMRLHVPGVSKVRCVRGWNEGAHTAGLRCASARSDVRVAPVTEPARRRHPNRGRGEILRIAPPRIEHFKNRPCVSVSAAAGEREGRAERASGCRACGSHQTCLRLLPPRSRRERFSCLLTSAAHTAHTRARRVLTPGSVRHEAEPRERHGHAHTLKYGFNKGLEAIPVPSRATRNQHAETPREPQPARRCSHRSPVGQRDRA
jgi:hypothetical protein